MGRATRMSLPSALTAIRYFLLSAIIFLALNHEITMVLVALKLQVMENRGEPCSKKRSKGPKRYGAKQSGPKRYGAKRKGPKKYGEKRKGPKRYGGPKKYSSETNDYEEHSFELYNAHDI